MSSNDTYRSIEVESLGKMYNIGKLQNQREEFLATSVIKSLVAPVRRAYKLARGQASAAADLDQEFWALRDINFTVNAGETVGIIGRNGAGKSTLLKILTRITRPTEGRTITRGRVASLLEVGTGFNMELTGRENVYLNGSILGMSRTEIDEKFDEIVAFSGVENFIDTPVKHYSSGMGVRLAFAVAAHLDTDILLVDEVLAVGDVAFQKKCFAKISDVASEGRTVLMVSHNMQAVSRFCERGILLEEGRLIQDGPIREVVASYLSLDDTASEAREWDSIESAPGNEKVRLKSVRVYSDMPSSPGVFDVRYPIHVEFEYWALEEGATFAPAFLLRDETETVVFLTGGMTQTTWREKPRSKGLYRSVCHIPANFLAEGQYTIDPHIHNVSEKILRPVNYVDLKSTLRFTIYDEVQGDTARGLYSGHFPGVVRPILDWDTQHVESADSVFL
ncbi:MAG: ABC transporter ATP-binding protein [Chloroflexota bacterium]